MLSSGENIVKATVRNLRRRSTLSEDRLWNAVRDRRMGGKKFQRQFPLRFEYHGCQRFFVADFYCHDTRLMIEVDGPVHERQRDYDEMRTALLQTFGIHDSKNH